MPVLAFNGSINDFLVAYFFFVTNVIGYVYLFLAGFEVPRDTGKQRYKKKESRSVEQHNHTILQVEYFRRLFIANSVIVALTTVALVGGIILFVNADDFFTHEGS